MVKNDKYGAKNDRYYIPVYRDKTTLLIKTIPYDNDKDMTQTELDFTKKILSSGTELKKKNNEHRSSQH